MIRSYVRGLKLSHINLKLVIALDFIESAPRASDISIGKNVFVTCCRIFEGLAINCFFGPVFID